jgi:hypothetical protein
MTPHLWRALITVIVLVSLGAVWASLRQPASVPDATHGQGPFQPHEKQRSRSEALSDRALEIAPTQTPPGQGLAEQDPVEQPAEIAAEPVLLDENHEDDSEPADDPSLIAALEAEANDPEEVLDTPGAPMEDGHDDERPRWEDPVNQAVLGPPGWMAEPSEDESARIQAVFDEAERQRAEHEDTFVLDDRRRAIELVRDAVEDCFDGLIEFEPEALGRVIVAFDIHADAGTAHLENGRITANVGLHFESFIGCVEETLGQITFGAVGTGVHEVELPVFLDE